MTLEDASQRREAVATIHEIVGAMRAIAAGRIQGAQRALAAARRYHDLVDRGLALVLAGSDPAADARRASGPATLLVMTSEQPFCGAFNQELIDLAERRRREIAAAGPAHLLVVGQRGMRQMVARGLRPDGGEPGATTLEGLRDLVKRLASLLARRHASGELASLRVLYRRYQSVSEQVPTEVLVLPPDLDAIRLANPIRGSQPHRYLDRLALLAGLVGEYVFISLYLLAVESYASEQASRLVAMDGATRNTETMLDQLLDQERRERQGEITREVLELIAARFAVDL